jgi:branched-subunit amino acid aminotransferase/4-amino-4-deoxychorismate lyase
MVVTESGELVMPRLETILQGTTMLRLRSLCESILEDGYIHGIESRDIGEEEIFSAREVMIVGTTLDVLPCVNYEGERIGDGRPGPVAQKALRLLRQDQDNPRDVSGRF